MQHADQYLRNRKYRIPAVGGLFGWVGVRDTLSRASVAAMLAVLAMRALWPAGSVETIEKGKTA